MLKLIGWVRAQPRILGLYRCLPASIRERISRYLAIRAASSAKFPRTLNWSLPTACLHEPAPGAAARKPKYSQGVNIVGYLRGQFGLAEGARMYSRALIRSGVPVALVDIDLDLPHGWDDHSLDPWIGEDMPHVVTILFINPDYLQHALDRIGRERLDGHHLIACWFWELEQVPESWIPAIDQVDEIMVSSAFIEDAFRRVTDKPIFRVALPLGEIACSSLVRADFGLDEDAFVFLCTFDFNSWIERKNPFAAIDAFVLAFPPERADVRLLLKSSNGFRYPEAFLRLLNAAAVDSRIAVRDEVIDRAHVNALHRSCDAYVSLHRAEGFGLGLAECMAIGKPVIATNWSGNLEFMDSHSACLVDYKLVPVPAGDYLHHQGSRWAQASIAEASEAMRRLADDPGGARQLGARGKRAVLERLAAGRCVDAIALRLEELATAMPEEVAH